jgi:membrane protease YdiL (CAAX protease family)
MAPFFLLVFALSLPMWLASWADRQILPGLPMSSITVVCPLAAALLLVARRDGLVATAALLKRSFDCRRIVAKGWYVPIVLLMPAIAALAYVVMRALDLPLPAPRLQLSLLSGLLALFLIAGLAEELGWSGYALDPLQNRWGALRASLILGAVWAAWHFVPLLQADRAPSWIAWWSLATVGTRILQTWLFNSTGKSVFGAALFHAMSNVSWQMFPNQGSHYDPRITGIIVAVTAVMVVATSNRQLQPRRTSAWAGD